MKNVERIPQYILNDIKQNVPFSRQDKPFTDEELNTKSKRDLLNHWLQWNGIIGYTDNIINAIEAIFDVDLNKEKS